MKIFGKFLTTMGVLGWGWSGAFAQTQLHLMDANYSDSNHTHQVVWNTEPGVHYALQSGSSLTNMETVSGFPTQAEQYADAYAFNTLTNPSQFFKVLQYDEQSPVVISRFPKDGDFAIPRFSTISISLSDLSGIDPSSISMTVSNLGTYTISDVELIFTNNVLFFDNGGDTALGPFGTNIAASLIVADINGNGVTNNWSFDLELETITSGDILVFGSPESQRMGQQLSASERMMFRNVYPKTGPIRMNGGASTWSIESVATNSISFTFSSNAPNFQVGQYLANATPSRANEIFYRQITSMSIDSTNQLFIVNTIDVRVDEMLQQGSFISRGTIASYLVDELGVLSQPSAAISMYEGSVTLPFGGAFSEELDFSSSYIDFQLSGIWEINPEITLAFDINWNDVEQLLFRLNADSSIGITPTLTATKAYTGNKQKTFIPTTRRVNLLGFLGFVPIWLESAFKLDGEAGIEVGAKAVFSTGISRTDSFFVELKYSSINPGDNGWSYSPEEASLYTQPFSYKITGHGKMYARVIPQLDFRIQSLIGAYVNLTPEVGLEGDAEFLEKPSGDDELLSADFELYGKINANAGLSLAFAENDDLPAFTPYSLVYHSWTTEYPGEFAIVSSPESRQMKMGASTVLKCKATAEYGTELKYQWLHDDIPLLEETNSNLSVNNFNRNRAGNYSIEVTAGDESTNSSIATLSLGGMVTIPQGINNSTNHTYSLTNEVSFYMDIYEVTNDEMIRVMQWAFTNGFINATDYYAYNLHGDQRTILNLGQDVSRIAWNGSYFSAKRTKGNGYPCIMVSWFGAASYCNYRSLMDGKTPCYDLLNWTCNYEANGYRLPTGVEWEYAARGGLKDKYFPWGDKINHSHANYEAKNGEYIHDNSPYSQFTYHPQYDWGGYPYTSPSGDFTANRYGLYDMAGNVMEWCNDWTNGNTNVRGGSWFRNAIRARCDYEYWTTPGDKWNHLGFRTICH